jgi:Cas6b C-terminal domain/Cas6b N-terminal domain
MPLPQTTIPITTIRFPELTLQTRDGHKLRGFFGNFFQDHSPLLHNHFDDGSLRYAYPLVQYKVLHTVPTLVGLGEGATLLAQLFLSIRQIDIDGHTIPVLSKHIEHAQTTIGLADTLHQYQFQTLWMALNQENYRDYRQRDEAGQRAQLIRVMTSQLLALFKDVGLWLPPENRIMLALNVQERTTQFKNQTMMAFAGGFTANVILPDGIGLGKGVSRGFGTVISYQ